MGKDKSGTVDPLETKNTEFLAAKALAEEKSKEFDDFHIKHKLKRGFGADHSDNKDEKVAKEWKKLKKEMKEARAKRDSLKEEIKELTPKKERTGGVATVYTYPKEVLEAADPQLAKKKFRAEARRLKKGGKPRVEGEDLKPKKSKEKVEEAPVEAKKKKKVEEAPVEAPKKKKKKED